MLLNSNFRLRLLLSVAMVCAILGLILETCGLGDRAATSMGAAGRAGAGRFFGGVVVIDLVVRTATFLWKLRAFLAAFFGAFRAALLMLFWLPAAAAAVAAAFLHLTSSSFFWEAASSLACLASV
jgi:hypothetical protein